MQLITEEQLEAQGLGKSSSQRRRDREAGLFPAAVRYGNRNLTDADEFEVFKRVIKARRDFPNLATKITEWLKKEKKAGRNPWVQEKFVAFLKSNGEEI
jgi:hypothetical protein